MPRPFAEHERQMLRDKLREVARARMEAAGVRGMSVADLTRQVGISKGAFYLLYDSKDALVMEVLVAVEAEVRAALRAAASPGIGTPTATMTAVVAALFDSVQRHPILSLLSDPEEGPLIFRMVSPAELEARMRDDDRWFSELAADLRSEGTLAADVEPAVLAGVARLALTVSRDPDLRRHPGLIDLLCESLGARLAGQGA